MPGKAVEVRGFLLRIDLFSIPSSVRKEGLNTLQNSFRNCVRYFVKSLIEEGIILLIIDKAHLYQNGRHIGAAQHCEVWPFIDALVGKADGFQPGINIFCHHGSAGVAGVN